jgi:hypothetical protein
MIHFFDSVNGLQSPYLIVIFSVVLNTNIISLTCSLGFVLAGELEDHSSKYSTSYLQRLKQELLGRESEKLSWFKRIKGEYCCEVLAAGSTSVSSRLVAMANMMVARTASIFSIHVSGSQSAFPPK